MDAAAKNRARNLAETQQRALDGVDFAIKKCAGSKSIRKAVVNALQENTIEMAASSLGYIPQNYVKLEGKQAQQLLRLMEELEDHDDVQNVWANFDIDEEEIAKYSN